MLAAQPSFAGQAAVRAVVQPQMALSDLKDLAKQQVLAATPSNMPTAPDRARPIHESRGRESIYISQLLRPAVRRSEISVQPVMALSAAKPGRRALCHALDGACGSRVYSLPSFMIALIYGSLC